MRIVSISTGRPRVIETPRGRVVTSIWKQPVTGPVAASGVNLEGDRQADLSVHGGPLKSVYGYPVEHNAYWREQLGAEIEPANFGENLALEGLLESDARIGDRYRFGTAILQVTQPRMPCYKLNLRFGRGDMVKRFWKSGLSGIYFSIVEPGVLREGGSCELVERGPVEITVAEVVRLVRDRSTDREALARAMASPLASSWKNEIRELHAALGE